ncbi:hypothetical protein OROMI_014122 [Orobanche minor]
MRVCKRNHEAEGERTDICVREEDCMAMWEAYQQAKPTTLGAEVLGVRCGNRVWRRPPKGRFRVDVDAAFDRQRNMFGVGVIVRDCNGGVVAALAKRIKPTPNVMCAEVKAVINGIFLHGTRGESD